MNDYLLIYIDQYYGEINGIRVVGEFHSEAAAQGEITRHAAKAVQLTRKFLDYIEKYVERIQVPEMSYEGWKKFVELYGLTSSYVNKENFKVKLKEHLNGDHELSNFTDYKPPKLSSFSQHNFYILNKSVVDFVEEEVEVHI